MQLYTTLKPFLVLILLLTSLLVFGIRTRRLVLLMQKVRGTARIPTDRWLQRLRVFAGDILLQHQVRRKFLPGLAHTLIFFGFVAVQPHTVALLLDTLVPGVNPGRWAPGLHAVYALGADTLAFLALLGLAYAAWRRLFARPDYLTDGTDARLILGFTALIIISFHFLNAFQMLLENGPARHYPISGWIAGVTGLNALGPYGWRLGLEISYWVHVGIILMFLAYIPGSKHLHLLAAVPNVLLAPLDIAKPMPPTDLEDESAESFGLGNIAELNWYQVLNLYACTECGRCQEKCPAAMTGKPLSPKTVVSDLKNDLFEQSAAVLKFDPQASDPAPIIREGAPITSDTLWACTTCRACEAVCPVDIGHLDFILEMRKQRVLMEADFPEELQETFHSLEHQYNPWGFGPDTRADWCRDLDVPLMSDHPEAEVLFFVGCAGSFDERAKRVSRSLVDLLHSAGVDFAILGPEERCTGDAARRAGNEYLAQMLIQANVATLKRYNPQKILTGCPHCYNALKNEYPHFDARFDVVHHSEFLAQLVHAKRLRPQHRLQERVTYHDSCYLGRWNGMYGAPRDLLKAIPGLNLQEMACNRDSGLCCGAGGARMFMEEDSAARINELRAVQADDTGANAVITACPFCSTMLDEACQAKGRSTRVLDIAEVLNAAVRPA